MTQLNYNYYKNLKLGVAKAEKFLHDLEIELQKISFDGKSGFKFCNVFTNNTIILEDNLKTRENVDEILSKLMHKYFVMHNDMLFSKNYDFNLIKLQMIVELYFECRVPAFRMYEMPGFVLEDILNFKTEDKSKQKLILFNLFCLELKHFGFKSTVTPFAFMHRFGGHIFDFCILDELPSNLKKDFVVELDNIDFDSFEEKKNLFKKIFGKEISERLLLDFTIFKLLDWYSIFDPAEFIDKLWAKLPKRTFHVQSEIVENMLQIASSVDDMDLNIKVSKTAISFKFSPLFPQIFDLTLPSLVLGKKVFIVDNDKLDTFFLKNLNLWRIKLNFEKILKVYKIDITFLKNVCLRYRATKLYNELVFFICDFFDNKELKDYELNENMYPYSMEIRYSWLILYAKRVEFHEKIFRNILMSCFDGITLNKESFFDKKDKWILKKK